MAGGDFAGVMATWDCKRDGEPVAARRTKTLNITWVCPWLTYGVVISHGITGGIVGSISHGPVKGVDGAAVGGIAWSGHDEPDDAGKPLPASLSEVLPTTFSTSHNRTTWRALHWQNGKGRDLGGGRWGRRYLKAWLQGNVTASPPLALWHSGTWPGWRPTRPPSTATASASQRRPVECKTFTQANKLTNKTPTHKTYGLGKASHTGSFC